MHGGTMTWVDVVSAVATAVAALLSIAALAVTIYVARIASRQARELANDQARREASMFISAWKQDVLAHGKAALVAARSIEALTSPRLAELLSDQSVNEADTGALRGEVRHLLAQLETEVALLRAIDTTISDEHQLPVGSLGSLLNEGAWMDTDATHLAILAFDQELDPEDVADHRTTVDALMNGSFVNLNPRLLAECAGYAPDDVPTYSQPGSPWPLVYEKRESLLMESSTLKGSWKPESLADAAARSLTFSTDRFEDALVALLRALGTQDEPSASKQPTRSLRLV